MKIRSKYEFEEGDVICNYMYNWVAIRVRNSDPLTSSPRWKHTNLDHGNSYFLDDDADKYLNNGTWFYMGNRVEREVSDKGYGVNDASEI